MRWLNKSRHPKSLKPSVSPHPAPPPSPSREGAQNLSNIEQLIVLFGGRRVGTLFREPYVEILLNSRLGWGDIYGREPSFLLDNHTGG